eukprot:CAMPEP_0185599750 /NCGR_PEP_ID=MMETSP0434-20130131/82914_1 /TAXON_ID=626734 ORGANISM="Favella taraikaensis, Strain Fe Narragansett Bay" /NCGR_SAMPLE_ID=MMETSP0434 /ASSEMBLY_ACC=CAM_ASM_000379 /LENGTH=133 /DNA_ID=CAMNT_0028229253 /DNA_START=459 /DNA_END=857 /DNA_ORIENTATION=+
MLSPSSSKTLKSAANPLLKPLEYYRTYWLAIKLEIAPCILGWLKNSKKLWPGPPVKEKITSTDKSKIVKLQTKILETLNFLISLTGDEKLIKSFFAEDQDLRMYVEALQFSPSPHVALLANALISKNYRGAVK